MRRFINIVRETYSEDNVALRNYLRDGHKFDPYHYWSEICEWAERDEDAQEAFAEILGIDFDDVDADKLAEEEPEIFYKLPEWLQARAAEWAVSYMMPHNPAEAATTDHLSMHGKQLLPRQTWLVHFTDDPFDIASSGFTHGTWDMSRLGLTTYFTAASKKDGGYNFAYIADSRHAKWAASQHKYGRHAVMFQNSGVHVWHYADEEDQVIFWGPDVKPREIVVLKESNGDWLVMRHNGDPVFKGKFEQCVTWVTQNFRQYRKVLTGF